MTDVETDKTAELIASDKVDGTDVFNEDGEKLGHIHNFMVDKLSGQVEYAVLKFGSVLGLGGDYYPVPWDALAYDTEQKGYVINVDKEALEKAPHFSDAEPTYDRAYGEQVYDAYGLSYSA